MVRLYIKLSTYKEITLKTANLSDSKESRNHSSTSIQLEIVETLTVLKLKL